MRTRGYLVLFTLALIWGASYLFIKIGVQEMSPPVLVALRLALSVVTLAVVVAIRPALIAGWRRYWRLAAVVGVVNIVVPYLLIAWSETRIASGVTAILNASTPLFTVLLANWWSDGAKETLTWRRGAGVALGFVGVGVLIGPSALSFGSGGLGVAIGMLAVLVAAAAYAVGALLSRGYGGSAQLVGPMTMQVAALAVMLPLALATGLPTHIPSPKALAAVATLGIFGTAIAYLLAFWLINNVGATRYSMVAYLLPCTALVWGALFQNEPVSWNALAGLALVLLGTLITNGTLKNLPARLGSGRRSSAPIAPAEAASSRGIR
jgi:drug/metabolite transporter (DMT)-like permease